MNNKGADQTAHNKGADQTVRMLRLICTFVVHIWHKTHFRMTWPNYCSWTDAIKPSLVQCIIIFWVISLLPKDPLFRAYFTKYRLLNSNIKHLSMFSLSGVWVWQDYPRELENLRSNYLPLSHNLCQKSLGHALKFSPCCDTPPYKYYLNMIKHSFSPKMCHKHFENWFTNKNLISKNIFE